MDWIEAHQNEYDQCGLERLTECFMDSTQECEISLLFRRRSWPAQWGNVRQMDVLISETW